MRPRLRRGVGAGVCVDSRARRRVPAGHGVADANQRRESLRVPHDVLPGTPGLRTALLLEPRRRLRAGAAERRRNARPPPHRQRVAVLLQHLLQPLGAAWGPSRSCGWAAVPHGGVGVRRRWRRLASGGRASARARRIRDDLQPARTSFVGMHACTHAPHLCSHGVYSCACATSYVGCDSTTRRFASGSSMRSVPLPYRRSRRSRSRGPRVATSVSVWTATSRS